MKRITKGMLEAKCDYLNRIMKQPVKPYREVNGPLGRKMYKANIGNYHISYAYGGVSLHRMMNEAGGVNCPIESGHVPKRELLNLMDAYISGLWDSDEFTGGD